MAEKLFENLNEGIRKDPFKVPEGYFDSLSKNIMDGIDKYEASANDEKDVTTEITNPSAAAPAKVVEIKSRRRLFGAAAAAVAALLIAGSALWFNQSANDKEMLAAADTAKGATATVLATAHHTSSDVSQAMADQSVSDTYIDDMADYAMIDNQDLYMYMTSE